MKILLVYVLAILLTSYLDYFKYISEKCIYNTLQIEFVAKSDFVGKVRNDRRCGLEFPLPGGKDLPSECNPDSENFCCSKV